jgi:cation diffusion facilitator family transporter
MSTNNLALISVLVNFVLALAKFIVGMLIASVSLIAEGIHSTLDVFSSAVAYLGIKQAQKVESEKYPYGRYRFESIAAFVIVILLAGSAIWILYEAYQAFSSPSEIEFSTAGIVVMAASIIFNELMARWKFKVGGENASLALVADAEHDRADVISSIGVLIGLFIIPYFPLADAIIAGLVGIYIIYESIQLARETIDSLVDVADKETEERIKEIAKQMNIRVEKVKSRKIGAVIFAEIEIDLPSNVKLDQATEVSQKLENQLTSKIDNLKQVVVTAKSHEISRSTIKQGFGFGRYRSSGPKGFGKGIKSQAVDLPKKQGQRIVIALSNNQISHFGSKKYLVRDIDSSGSKLFEKIIDNPFYSKQAGKGVKFAKSSNADKVIAAEIGQMAKRNLESAGIEVEISKEKKIK